MDPVTVGLIAFVFAYLGSERIRKGTHGTARTIGAGIKRLLTKPVVSLPFMGPDGASGGSGKPPASGGQRRPPMTTRPSPKPAAVPAPRNTGDAGQGREWRIPRGRPKDPDKPAFGHPVKTTKTTVTTIRPATPEEAKTMPPENTPKSTGKHAAGDTPAASSTGTVTGGAEKIPAHIAASEKAASALEKVVTKFRQVAQQAGQDSESGKAELRAVITNASAAEKLQIQREPLASHKEAASSAHAALAALGRLEEAATAAAAAVAAVEEKAKTAHRVEQQAFARPIEEMAGAPIGGQANVSTLRS